MDNLEKRFFDTFGIEPKHKCTDGALEPCDEQCNYCGYYELKYPQITDTHYLELICILNPYCYPSGENIQHLKEGVLGWCIKFENDIKQQVQALFK